MTTKEDLEALWNTVDKSKDELKVINPKTLRYSDYYYTVEHAEGIFYLVEEVYGNFLFCTHMEASYISFIHGYAEIISIDEEFDKEYSTVKRIMKVCSYLPEYNTCRKYKVK